MLARSGKASGDTPLKLQGQEGGCQGQGHPELLGLPPWAPGAPSVSFKSQRLSAGLAKESKRVVFMKHILFLRR